MKVSEAGEGCSGTVFCTQHASRMCALTAVVTSTGASWVKVPPRKGQGASKTPPLDKELLLSDCC